MPDEESDGSPDIVDNVAKEIVEIILKYDHSKKPIKKTDIVSLITTKPARRSWNCVIEKVRNRLGCLGLELVEVKNTSVKSYFVIRKHTPTPFLYKFVPQTESADRILLTIVLTFIFMNNGMVSRDDLINHLKKLKIFTSSDSSHQYFGYVEWKIFHEFVEQLYISLCKVTDSDMVQIRWGQRADAEVSKLSILKFVCQCGFSGKFKPENFVSHYAKAVECDAGTECAQEIVIE